MNNPNGIKYCADGLEFDDPESNQMGDGNYAPFVIFDIENQCNLPGEYKTRADAESVLKLIKD